MFTLPGITVQPVPAGELARGRRDGRPPPASPFAVTSVPGHSPGTSRLSRRRPPLLRRRPLRRLGRPHRPARRRLETCCRPRSPRCSTRTRPRPSSTRATARRRRSAPSSRATRSSPICARRGASDERQDRAPPRHARRRARGDAALAAGHRRGRAPVRALRLPQDPDAGVRGHGALRAHVGAGLGRRAEGDVHLHRPLRPLAHPATRGNGADLPRLRRARHAPRSAAREDVHDRADVSLRRAAARAATASTGRHPSRRSAPPTRRSTPS